MDGTTEAACAVGKGPPTDGPDERADGKAEAADGGPDGGVDRKDAAADGGPDRKAEAADDGPDGGVDRKGGAADRGPDGGVDRKGGAADGEPFRAARAGRKSPITSRTSSRSTSEAGVPSTVGCASPEGRPPQTSPLMLARLAGW
jgi:hypothetical protein